MLCPPQLADYSRAAQAQWFTCSAKVQRAQTHTDLHPAADGLTRGLITVSGEGDEQAGSGEEGTLMERKEQERMRGGKRKYPVM